MSEMSLLLKLSTPGGAVIEFRGPVTRQQARELLRLLDASLDTLPCECPLPTSAESEAQLAAQCGAGHQGEGERE